MTPNSYWAYGAVAGCTLVPPKSFGIVLRRADAAGQPISNLPLRHGLAGASGFRIPLKGSRRALLHPSAGFVTVAQQKLAGGIGRARPAKKPADRVRVTGLDSSPLLMGKRQ